MKKASTKKILGGLMIAILIGTIGAVMVSADDTTDDDVSMPQNFFDMRPRMMHRAPFAQELTDEQQTELQSLITTLRDEGATQEEIHNAIQEKLAEWGIEIEPPEISDEERDEHLDTCIEQTQEQLQILNRMKELREQGLDYDEINDIIQEEYDVEPPVGFGCRHGMNRGHWYQSEDNSPEEDASEL